MSFVKSILYLGPQSSVIMMHMALWGKQQLLTALAMSALFFFMTVSLVHALVPHDHAQDSYASVFGLPVHNAGGEKHHLSFLLASLLVGTTLRLPTKEFFVVARLTGPLRAPDTSPPRIYTYIFARGILHSKAH